MALRRARSLLLFLPVLLLGGCGGCDSCFGTAETLDASPVTTATSKPAAVDAAVARVEESDAGSDGPYDAAVNNKDATAVPIPAVARPKAPMPLGAYQVCGVYDGPLCEKTCLNGACRQECDAVHCNLTCQGGYCSQACGTLGDCTMSCAGGHCVQVCAKPEGCTKTCTGGSCQ